MSSVEEPDYVEVYEDLKSYIESHGWKGGAPKWALDWACEEYCYVESPVIFYRAWKFVAERAMHELEVLKDKVEDARLEAAEWDTE